MAVAPRCRALTESDGTRGEGRMTTGDGHPLATLPMGALVMALSFGALAMLGLNSTATAAPPVAHGKAAAAIVDEARQAMTSAGSVSATGGGMTPIPGLGRATVSESDYAGPASGSQVLTVTSAGSGGPSLPSATTLDIAGSVYIDANAAFWSASMGADGAHAAAVAGHWVQVPTSSPVYAAAAADLTMSSLTRDLFDARTYHLGKTQTMGGVRAVAVAYRNSGTDAGPVTCYVAVGGSHLPVAVTVGGVTLHLAGWGVARALAVPTGATPMPGLTSPTTSTTPVVA